MEHRRIRVLPSRRPGIEAVQADTALVFGRHVHEQFGFGLIERGAQKSASGRGMVEAGAGDMLTVNPGEVHDGTPLGEGGRAWRMLYLAPAVVAELASDITAGRPSAGVEFDRPVLHDPRLAGPFRRLFSALTQGEPDPGALEADGLLLQLLGRLLQLSPDAPRSVPAGIAAARSLIDDDPTATLSLATLAGEARLSRYQLLRGFTRATGLTPHAYLMQRRIHRARAQIGQGVPLAEAAEGSGFADQSHMTRLFVRSFGIAPGAYAKVVR